MARTTPRPGYVARAGGLAVALGLGAAVATGQGLANAETPDSSDPDSAPAAPSGGAESTLSARDPVTDDARTTDAAADRTTAGHAGRFARNGRLTPTSTVSDGVAKPGQVVTTGGAHTSRHRRHENATNREVQEANRRPDTGDDTGGSGERASAVTPEVVAAPKKAADRPVLNAGRGSQRRVDSTAGPATVGARTRVDAAIAPVPRTAAARAPAPAKPAITTATSTPPLEAARKSEFSSVPGATPEPPTPARPRAGRLITGLLSAVGLAPAATPTAPTPPSNPLLLAVLAWIRREIEHTYFNDTPTITNATTTGQTTTNGATTITGTITAADDDDPMTYTVGDTANGGSAEITSATTDPATGQTIYTYAYTPTAELARNGGTDSFTFTVTDADPARPHYHGILAALFHPATGHTDSIEVTVDVEPVNATPTAADLTASTDEDRPAFITIDLINADPDNTADELTVTADETSTGGGDVSVTGNVITYTPHADFLAEGELGRDTFHYTITDPEGAAATGLITIDLDGLDDAPTVSTGARNTIYTVGTSAVAVDSGIAVGDVDSALALVQVTITAPESGDVLDLGDYTGPVSVGSYTGGVLTLVDDGTATVDDYQRALRAVTFTTTTLDPDERTITFTVSDGEATREATKTLIVNEPPMIALFNPTTSTSLRQFTVRADVAFADPDNDNLTIREWGFNDGVVQEQVTYESGTVTYTYTATGPLPANLDTYVDVTVEDGRGGEATQYLHVVVSGGVLTAAVTEPSGV